MALPTENGKIDWGDEEHLAFFNKQRHQFEDLMHRRAAEANETERSLCAQLMLLGTVLVTATGLILVEAANEPSYSLLQKILTVAGLGLLLASVFSGIKYYSQIIAHHIQWGNTELGIVEYISKKKFSTNAQLGRYIERAYGPLKITLDPKHLKRQVDYLRWAFVIYLLLVVAFLFDFGLTRSLETHF